MLAYQAVRPLSAAETRLLGPAVRYVALATGDLNGDSRDDLVALDTSSTRLLQVLTRAPDGDWPNNFTIKVSDIIQIDEDE